MCSNKMKIKIGGSSEKPKNNTLNTLANIIGKISTNERIAVPRFLVNNNHTKTLTQTQLHSNSALLIEAELQRCKGLLYANITRFR